MGISDLTGQGIAPMPGAVVLGNVNYIPPGLEQYYKESFTYNAVFSSIGSGVTQSVSVQIQNDSYFVVVAQMAEIFDAATLLVNTSPTIAPMTVRIQDSSSGKFLMDQATPIANVFGTGVQPHVSLYRSKLFLPGGQITVELFNGMSAAQRVRLSFEGFKVFRVPDQLPTM